MKRPLAVVGFTMLISLCLLCAFNSVGLSLACCLIAYVLFMVSCFVKDIRNKFTLPTVFFTLIITCFMFYVAQGNYTKLASLADTDTNIICKVQEKPVYNEEYGRYYCKAEVVRIGGKNYSGNIRLSFNTKYDDIDIDNFEIGNKLSFDGHLYGVGGEDSDIINYFKSENIYIGAYSIKNLSVLSPDVRPLAYYGEMLRSYIAASLSENFSRDTAGFLTALLTGSKDYISDGLYDNFKRSGVAHIMAVSGMHLAVMVMLVDMLIKRLRNKHKYLYFAIMCCFLFLVMFVASFSSSVVRAGVMMLIVLAGRLVNRRGDSLNSLGFACICILTVNTFSAMNVGFLLSVTSVWSIIVIAVPFCRRYRYHLADKLAFSGNVTFAISRAIMFSIAVSFSVMVCTLPIMVMNFGEISLISPLTNLLFLPVITIIIYMALVSAVLCGMGIMPDFLAYIAEKLSQYCLWVTELLGGSDTFMVKVDSDMGKIICCLMPLVLYIAIKTALYLRKNLKNKIKPL